MNGLQHESSVLVPKKIRNAVNVGIYGAVCHLRGNRTIKDVITYTKIFEIRKRRPFKNKTLPLMCCLVEVMIF